MNAQSERYLSEDFYFFKSDLLHSGPYAPSGSINSDFPIDVAVRTTIQQIAQWADEYHVYTRFGPASYDDQGSLEGTGRERSEKIVQVLDRLLHVTGAVLTFGSPVAFALNKGGRTILDQHDGIPGILYLTPQQYTELQEAWRSQGLPADLYYPETLQHIAVEPTEHYGGVFLINRRYSPLLWQHRDEQALKALYVPSEEERRSRFDEERQAFTMNVMRRVHELQEPGRAPNQEEIAWLGQLIRMVGKLGEYK